MAATCDSNNLTIFDFLKDADENAVDILKIRAREMELVSAVDTLFHTELLGHQLQMPASACLLSLNSYYSFLAAVRVALSGQVSAVFPLLRNSLESACYAFVMTKNPDAEKIWVQRQRNQKSKAACKKLFGSAVSQTTKHLNESNPALGGYVSELYETTIDFGAHPNIHSILYQLALKENLDGSHLASVTCLENPENINVAGSLMACAEAGLGVAMTLVEGSLNHPLQNSDKLAEFFFLFQNHKPDIISEPLDSQQTTPA